jgi:hypothetical protein
VPVNDDNLPDHDRLIQAAHAASSWVRARRGTWASEPEAAAPTLPEVAGGDFEFLPAVAGTLHPSSPLPSPTPSAATGPEHPHDDRLDVRGSRLSFPELSEPVRRWLAGGAIGLALIAAAFAGGPYLWRSLPARPVPPAAVTPTRAEPAAVDKKPPLPAVASRKGMGSLRVSSNPAGAQVVVDGKARGVTPLTLADVSPGRHDVALQSDVGTVTRTVTVSANSTTSVDEAIFSGFVTVYSPFEVTVSENGKVLRVDDRHQIMLPAGPHELQLVNRALEYEAVRKVDVKPGDATNLQLTPNPSPLTVTASDAAEVWLDGTRVGVTPMNAMPVPLGVHEIVVKRAAGGERRFNVTIGAKPFTLNVDF